MKSRIVGRLGIGFRIITEKHTCLPVSDNYNRSVAIKIGHTFRLCAAIGKFKEEMFPKNIFFRKFERKRVSCNKQLRCFLWCFVCVLCKMGNKVCFALLWPLYFDRQLPKILSNYLPQMLIPCILTIFPIFTGAF